ncbi:MAG: hypothetical protein HYR76_07650 [Ignavibacteria bacterium]|nr:hypothetical protein [Ignavibacteria bacterium]MBI3766637.1 hypothetical protein [Ignavibacteriales bacterium]
MYSQTRAQLTQTDYEFIAHTLGHTTQEQAAILQLTSDPHIVTDLLHHRQLFERSMTTPPLFLSISPHLFFYIFVYRALDQKHIADDDVVDYVAGICVEFRSHEVLWQLASTTEGKTIYLVDLLNLMVTLDRHQQYFLRRYIGNLSLFLTGFFPDFIFQRSKKKGAPSLEYYESVGRTQYETAAGDSSTYDLHAAPVLNTLAERFVEIRSAINIFTDSYLHLSHNKHSFEQIQRQISTLDDESLKQSLDV